MTEDEEEVQEVLGMEDMAEEEIGASAGSRPKMASMVKADLAAIEEEEEEEGEFGEAAPLDFDGEE